MGVNIIAFSVVVQFKVGVREIGLGKDGNATALCNGNELYFLMFSALFIDCFFFLFFLVFFMFTIVLRDVVRPQRRNAQTGNLIRYRLQITRLNFYRLYSRLRSKLAFFFFTSVVLISRADAIQTF